MAFVCNLKFWPTKKGLDSSSESGFSKHKMLKLTFDYWNPKFNCCPWLKESCFKTRIVIARGRDISRPVQTPINSRVWE